MTAWLIILIALWSFPVIGFVLVKITRSKPELRKLVIRICIGLNILAGIGLLTNISTTVKELDWIVVSLLYLSVCIMLWLVYFQRNKIASIVAVVVMILVFGIGYISGSIGALGVAFVTGEYNPSVEKWLGNGIIYKETILGNAVSDHRGKRIEIYKTIPWFPVVEWRIQNKVYTEYIAISSTPLAIEYKPIENNIYLSASIFSPNENRQVYWSDTLSTVN